MELAKSIKVKFLGGIEDKKLGANLTGSMTMLTIETTQNNIFKVLIDAGAFQGCRDQNRLNENLEIKPSEIDYILCTHDHVDHIGRVPYLVKKGFKGLIYMSKVSGEKARYIWEDQVGLMKLEESKISAIRTNLFNAAKLINNWHRNGKKTKTNCETKEALELLKKFNITTYDQHIQKAKNQKKKLKDQKKQTAIKIKKLLGLIQSFNRQWGNGINEQLTEKPEYCENNSFVNYQKAILKLEEANKIYIHISNQLEPEEAIKKIRKEINGLNKKIRSLQTNNTNGEHIDYSEETKTIYESLEKAVQEKQEILDKLLVQKTLLDGGEGGLSALQTKEIYDKLPRYSPLFDEEDIKQTIFQLFNTSKISNKNRKGISLSEFIKVRFFNADHIEGGLQFLVSIATGNNSHNNTYFNILFSGDLGANPHGPTQKIDFGVFESTYAYKSTHPPREEAEKELIRQINSTKKHTLVATLANQRTQDLLKTCLSHKKSEAKKGSKAKKPKLRNRYIECDSQLANNISTILLNQIKEKYKYLSDGGFYWIVDESGRYILKNALQQNKGRKLIFSSSGMANGGPIMQYLPIILKDPDSKLIFTSFLSENTKGHLLREWVKGRIRGGFQIKKDIVTETIKMNGNIYKIAYRVPSFENLNDKELRAMLKSLTDKQLDEILEEERKKKIVQIEGFTSHISQSGLIEYISGLNLRKGAIIALNHGGESRYKLAHKLQYAGLSQDSFTTDGAYHLGYNHNKRGKFKGEPFIPKLGEEITIRTKSKK